MTTETYFLEPCPSCGEPAAMITSAAGSFYVRCNNVRCKFDRFARASLTRRDAATQWNNICRRYIESRVEEARRCPVCGGRAIVVNAVKDVDIAIQKWNEMFTSTCSSDLAPITHEEFISFLGGE